jgi:spore germination protein
MYEIYTMKEGDTLEQIALMYNTTVGILREINGIIGDYGLNTGTQIVVPVKKKHPYQYYTVKKGDNMYDIAKNYGIDYSLLLQLNGLDEGDYVYPNQTIMLPKKGLGIYMTKSDDTLDLVLSRIGIEIEELIRENENIYLRENQILVFREK